MTCLRSVEYSEQLLPLVCHHGGAEMRIIAGSSSSPNLAAGLDPARGPGRAPSYGGFGQIQGRYYASCMHRSIALYERGADAIPAHAAFHRALYDKALAMTLRNAGVELNYSFRTPLFRRWLPEGPELSD